MASTYVASVAELELLFPHGLCRQPVHLPAFGPLPHEARPSFALAAMLTCGQEARCTVDGLMLESHARRLVPGAHRGLRESNVAAVCVPTTDAAPAHWAEVLQCLQDRAFRITALRLVWPTAEQARALERRLGAPVGTATQVSRLTSADCGYCLGAAAAGGGGARQRRDLRAIASVRVRHRCRPNTC